ncbi:Uncharacterised protein [Mycobacterium tuberculosis]|nr:Uncharacterised protein [Mycobacterium tuberculosis]
MSCARSPIRSTASPAPGMTRVATSANVARASTGRVRTDITRSVPGS